MILVKKGKRKAMARYLTFPGPQPKSRTLLKNMNAVTRAAIPGVHISIIFLMAPFNKNQDMELKAKVSSTKTTIDFLIIEIDALSVIFCYLLLTNIYWLGLLIIILLDSIVK